MCVDSPPPPITILPANTLFTLCLLLKHLSDFPPPKHLNLLLPTHFLITLFPPQSHPLRLERPRPFHTQHLSYPPLQTYLDITPLCHTHLDHPPSTITLFLPSHTPQSLSPPPHASIMILPFTSDHTFRFHMLLLNRNELYRL